MIHGMAPYAPKALMIGLTHHQHDFAARVNSHGGPPLAAIQHVFVTVATNFQFHVSGIGRRHLGFCHRIGNCGFRRPTAASTTSLVGAVLGQHFHIAPVRGITVEYALRPGNLAHRLEQWRDLYIGQPRTPGLILVRQEQVPQALGLGQFTNLVIPGWHCPELVLIQTLFLPVVLAREDMFFYKRLQPGIQFHHSGTFLKPHRPYPSPVTDRRRC